MCFISDFIETSVKLVLAPVYVPYKLLEEADKNLYEYWYHDSGMEQERDETT